MERVRSKNLFHYKLIGEVDHYVAGMEKKMVEEMEKNPSMKKMFLQANSDDPLVPDDIAVQCMGAGMDRVMQIVNELLKDAIEQCNHTEFKVPKRNGNDFEVPVLVHTPKRIADKSGNAAVIYAHGGGAVSGSAEQMRGLLSHHANETGVVFFNVDYRLAPETKCPKNALDFYCAVKHIKEHAGELGVDPSRLAISGESGGGYICFATMVILAQNNETDLVKLAIPAVPMISDLCFSDPAAMTEAERKTAFLMRRTWRCIANDFEAQKNNPLLFPAKASDEIIAKMPPTIIWEMEFDMFITENERMAHRMRKMGRLLEFRVQPGMDHGSWCMPGTKGFIKNTSDYKLAIEQYLL